MKKETNVKKKKEPTSKVITRIICLGLVGLMVIGMAYYAIYAIINGV